MTTVKNGFSKVKFF